MSMTEQNANHFIQIAQPHEASQAIHDKNAAPSLAAATMTAEQEAEIDKLVDQGFNYKQARVMTGVESLTGSIQLDGPVLTAIHKRTQEIRAAGEQPEVEVDEIRVKAEEKARRLGGHPDDYDPRYQ